MTQDEIIKLMQQACDPDKKPAWHNGFWTITQEELERFATLVAAAGREKFAAMENDQNESDLLTIAYVSGFKAGKKKRKLKPLTDEEILKVYDDMLNDLMYQNYGNRLTVLFARAIEQAHGIGEKE